MHTRIFFILRTALAGKTLRVGKNELLRCTAKIRTQRLTVAIAMERKGQ